MKIKRVCQTCGREFEIYQSSLEKSNASGKFCCRKCYNEYQRTLTGEKNNHSTRYAVKCANCGKDIYTIPSRAKVYKNKFCSNKCRSEFHHKYIEGEKNCNWKGGAKGYRGKDFELVKRKYFRDACCVLCGTKEGVHIHHLIPYRLTQDNSLENLVPLCRKHHKMMEWLFTSELEKLGNYEITKAILRNIMLTYHYSHLTKENTK